jgi:hypothetical protein
VVVCEVGEPAAATDQGDLEDNDQLLVRTITTLRAEVARNGGQVVEILADVVVAVFGLPRTHDVDAERAVLAALAARDRLATSALGERRMRAGVATGQALVRLGEPAEVGGWEIPGEVPRPRSDRAPPLVLGAELIGRDGELAVLLDRYQRSRAGDSPQLVTLVGQAGIGKTGC